VERVALFSYGEKKKGRGPTKMRGRRRELPSSCAPKGSLLSGKEKIPERRRKRREPALTSSVQLKMKTPMEDKLHLNR